MLSRDADYAFYLYTCNRCRGCTTDRTPELRPVCASYAMKGFFPYSGGGKGYVAQGILEGKVKPDLATLEVAMTCLTCGACAKMCPPGFETINFIRDLRSHIVSKGIYLNETHKELIDNVIEHGNPWGIRKPHGAHIEGLPVFAKGMEVAIYTGCRDRYKSGPLDNVVKILGKAGVSYGMISDEMCCGGPLLDLGAKADFERMAENNIEKLNSLGAEKVVSLCPHCVSTMNIDYMNIGYLETEIVSVPTLINDIVSEGKIEFHNGEAEIKVTYHDPCHLGRYMEEIDAPREILAAVPAVELIEMERTGLTALCCGAGSVMENVVPELAKFAGRERIHEAKATGADTVITACSYCADFMRRQAGKSIKVTELSEFVLKKLA